MRWEDTQTRPEQATFKAEPQYEESCYAFAHEPTCQTYVDHLRRLHRERVAAGGEAALKAKVGFWQRTIAKR